MKAIRGADPVAMLILGVGLLAGAAFHLWVMRGTAFFIEEWRFYLGDYPHDYLEPFSGHLFLVGGLVYRGLLEVFGAGSLMPFRIATVVAEICLSLLLFALARPLCGDRLAAAFAVLLFFFGAAYELGSATYGFSAMLSIGFGLAALLCLREQSPRRDAGAAVALALSVGALGWGLAFVAAAAVAIWQRGGRARIRGAWIVALPILLYGLWTLVYGDAEGEVTGSNVIHLPIFVFDSLASDLAAVTGLFAIPFNDTLSINQGIGIPLAIAALAGLGWMFVKQREKIPPVVWVFGAGLLAFWVAAGLITGPLRPANAPRYTFPGAIFLFLIAAALIGDPRGRRGITAALIGVLVFSFALNARELQLGGDYFRNQAAFDTAQLAMLDAVRPAVRPGVVIEPPSVAPDSGEQNINDLNWTAGDYYRARDRFGTPFSPDHDLYPAADVYRAAADNLLVRAYDLGLAQLDRPLRPRGAVIRSPEQGIGRLLISGRCVKIAAVDGLAATAVRVPVGGFAVDTPRGAQVQIALRRTASAFTAPFAIFRSHGPVAVAIPEDRLLVPWKAAVSANQSLLICPLPSE